MFGNNTLFDDNASLTTDVWNERVSNTAPRNRFPDYVQNTSSAHGPTPSLVARTLHHASGFVTNNDPPQATRHKERRAAEPQSAPTPMATTAPDTLIVDSVESQVTYCDAYPNTNTTLVDWALYAAHRVALITGIELEKSKNSGTSTLQERNLATIFLGKCSKGRFKNDQRTELLEKLTLQGILLAIFLPHQLTQYLHSIAAQHTRLELAARQCTTQIEQCLPALKSRAALERDLLIKRILFHADNGQTECTFSIDSHLELKSDVQWSLYTLDSVKEPDLFGRAIGVLVHQVLQSASLRVKAAAPSDDKSKIHLILSWKAALDNLRIDSREKDAPERQGERHGVDRQGGERRAVERQGGEREAQSAKPSEARERLPHQSPTSILDQSLKSTSAQRFATQNAPYLPNPLFDNETFINAADRDDAKSNTGNTVFF